MEAMNSQDFHRIDNTLLGHLNHRKLPVVQRQVVLAPEVRLDVDRLLFASSFVDQVDGVLASVAVDQALDDEVGAQDGTATVVRLDLQLLEAAMDFTETLRLGLSAVTIIDGLQKINQVLPVTSVENGHGGSHEGSPGPETGVRNIHVHNESTMLEHGFSTKYEVRNQRTYNGRPNSLVNALESENTISQVLVLSILIEEGSFDSKELLARVFTKNVVKEVYLMLVDT